MNNSKRRANFSAPLPDQVGGLKGSHYRKKNFMAIPSASPGSNVKRNWSPRRKKGKVNKEIAQWVASTRVSV